MNNNESMTINFEDEKALEIEIALNVTIWELLKELDHNFNFIKLYDVANWEQCDDSEILNTIDVSAYLTGEIFIINDASYLNKIIFKTTDDEICEFVNSYNSTFDYRECLFDGDAFFISLESMNMLYFHHEGIWFLYQLPLI